MLTRALLDVPWFVQYAGDRGMTVSTSVDPLAPGQIVICQRGPIDGVEVLAEAIASIPEMRACVSNLRQTVAIYQGELRRRGLDGSVSLLEGDLRLSARFARGGP
jgi:hypothetical protein